MTKIKGDTLRTLKQIAEKLPKTYYKGNCALIREVHDLELNEIKNNALAVNSNPRILSDNKEYIVSDTPTVFEHNHLRFLKRAFKRSGWEGVREYVNECKVKDERMYNYVKDRIEYKAIKELIRNKIKPIFG